MKPTKILHPGICNNEFISFYDAIYWHTFILCCNRLIFQIWKDWVTPNVSFPKTCEVIKITFRKQLPNPKPELTQARFKKEWKAQTNVMLPFVFIMPQHEWNSTMTFGNNFWLAASQLDTVLTKAKHTLMLTYGAH